jgi:predicted NUDIX family phosphoesterase
MNKFQKIDKKITVEYSGKRVHLPKNIQAKIDKHWEKLTRSNGGFFRGEGFHIIKIIEGKKEIRFVMALSDYAHYVYSRYKGLSKKYVFKNIHTSCLIETSDNFIVLGVMGETTVIPNNIQCVGGGLDNGDLKKNRFNLRHNIKKELLEEVGIDCQDKKTARSLALKFLCHYNNVQLNGYAAIFVLKLRIKSAEFKKRYKDFEKNLIKKELVPEFKRLIYIKNNKKDIENSIKNFKKPDYYLEDLLRDVAK